MNAGTSRRDFITSAVAATAGLLFRACTGNQRYNRRPNILFLLVDDQRHDTLGCAGFPVVKTPNIDALAQTGVRFCNAFVTTSICAASRASIFTGLYERTHGYTFRTPPLSDNWWRNSYPALLRQSGYRTGFIGKFGVNVAGEGADRPFDYFQKIDRNPYFKRMENGQTRHTAELAGDYAIDFFRSQSKTQPFCLSVSFNAVHAEDSDKIDHYPPPKAVSHLYANADMPLPRLGETFFKTQPDFLKTCLNRVRYFWRWDTPEKYQKNMRNYLRMISGVDRVIGRVQRALQQYGLVENTVIIYSADNGYYMGDRGFAGKWSHYEESLRIPLIMNGAALSANTQGRVLDEMVLNIDLPATLLDLAGIPVPPHVHGKSLLPLIKNDSIEWRRDFFCEHLMQHPQIPKWEGVRDKRYVYARYFEQEPVYEFLHDLERDPDQFYNYAQHPEYAEVIQALRQRCDDFIDRYQNQAQPQ